MIALGQRTCVNVDLSDGLADGCVNGHSVDVYGGRGNGWEFGAGYIGGRLFFLDGGLCRSVGRGRPLGDIPDVTIARLSGIT